jgi:hypothetical protein
MTSQHLPAAGETGRHGDVVSVCLNGDTKSLEIILESHLATHCCTQEAADAKLVLSQGLIAAAKFPQLGAGLPKMLIKQSCRMIKQFLAHGVTFDGIEKPFLIESLKSSNLEALDIASKSGLRIQRYSHACADAALAIADKKCIGILEKYGIGINLIDDHFETPFLRLCANRIMFQTDEPKNPNSNSEQWYLDKIATLVDAGVDIEIKDKVGATGLMRCIIAGNYPLAKALISLGVDLSVRLPNGVSTSHLAATHSPRDFLQFFLRHNPCPSDLSRLHSKRIQPDSKSLIAQHIKSVS